MCGIVGYIGERQAYDVLIKGLYRLEYRGYDSAGIAYVKNNNVVIKLEKIFDNMFENILSYGNMIKMAFNIQSVNGKWYSLSANGIGILSTFTNRFTVDEVIGKSFILHQGYDDFTSQPAGNAGSL